MSSPKFGYRAGELDPAKWTHPEWAMMADAVKFAELGHDTGLRVGVYEIAIVTSSPAASAELNR